MRTLAIHYFTACVAGPSSQSDRRRGEWKPSPRQLDCRQLMKVPLGPQLKVAVR